MIDCLFCKIVVGEIPCHKVWEDEAHIAFLDINPMHEGHTLVIPKAHVSYVFDMEDVAYGALFVAVKTVAARLKIAFDVPRIGVAVEGFAVDHVHVHLVPLTGVGQLDPSLAKREDNAILASTAKKILAPAL